MRKLPGEKHGRGAADGCVEVTELRLKLKILESLGSIPRKNCIVVSLSLRFFCSTFVEVSNEHHQVSTPHCLITATRYLLPQSRNSFSISTAALIASNRFDRGFQRKPNQFEGNAERTLTKLRQSEYQIDAIWMFSLYSVAPAATIWNRLIADGNENMCELWFEFWSLSSALPFHLGSKPRGVKLEKKIFGSN